MATVTVSEKGWVVIPKEIRDRYGITKGDKIHILEYGDRIFLVPATKGDPVKRLRGMLKSNKSMTEALLEDRRSEAEIEERKYRDQLKRHDQQ
jgi:AbrB family looped-hinge helix DNA binding protein